MIERKRKYIFNILPTLLGISVFWNCAVDVKQVPRGGFPNSNPIAYNEPVYIGKFEVLDNTEIGYSSAWKHAFRSSLLDNRVFSEVIANLPSEKRAANSLVLDVEISPNYEEKYNMWWTWPAIYPFTFTWPVQMRTGNYSITIRYSLYRENQIITQSKIEERSSETVTIYGFYHTPPFENMIQTTNAKALVLCASNISKKPQ
ncbi:hypothetical protein EHQ27_03090 [Leptospira wolffii]|uniref:LBF_2127 family putative lipoprotein n=1 Tax=Leptospira wolffii TaxID=409998 RepID=UPI00108441F7|nr:hypothetical protein [Leptospira wolffii]TGK64857.1 hypothetical protein EHQ32_01160 [Leptospira wolffii]TGK76744.1 hypothetical protein EHQ35_00055 [Leptospira wolffii]TGK77404.1 hypothetical protein EHQ27_03090 [Leptospira wolffii]TGL26799.1 hypothetical protein EHQ57_18995 [Leptospira wolffii]